MRDPIRLIVLLFGSTLFGGAFAAAVGMIAHPDSQGGGAAGAGLVAGFALGLLLAAWKGDS
jgi:hypothetical protein